MTPIVIRTDRLFTPFEEIQDAILVIRGGKISAMGRRGEVDTPRGIREINAREKIVVPGFVDLHIHGAGGHDVMEGTTDALEAIAATVAIHGTTSIVATTVTASEIETCASVKGIATHILRSWESAPRELSAEILGIHFEGPFISAARRGVHPSKWIATPSSEIFEEILKKARGTAQIITLAPELPGALDLIADARRAGLVISLGHTDATYEQAMAAIEAGATHAAHVYNAMRPFSHRETGVLGAVLTSPKVSAELIADGVHVDEAAMRILVEMKTPERVILVSDGISATGMPDGRYQLGKFEVKVSKGVARNAEGKLAGSTLTLDRALRNMVALGVPFPSALRMITANPARQIGLAARKGILAVGADADLVLLNDKLEVSGVMTKGVGLNLTN
ncbi:MAG TPA: N-acetylglucosamine-6-phosphate deacetylase [Candidatus Saccharimonadales bacterium]|jgi:N-acetylglucosamine-6-phosphate deacetylase|nr:N-acetylglucosamine-6-phosphate deacetylase [Candidatus Saccharimonadales bacterium]